MGVSHTVLATDDKDMEGLMVDVEGDPGEETFDIGIGKWSTGKKALGFNAEISGVSYVDFSKMVDELIAIRERYGKLAKMTVMDFEGIKKALIGKTITEVEHLKGENSCTEYSDEFRITCGDGNELSVYNHPEMGVVVEAD